MRTESGTLAAARPGCGGSRPSPEGKAWDLEVLRGPAAIAAALTPARRREWQALVDRATHVAAFQSPAFVLTWYELYEPLYEPVLLLGLGARDEVVGVMPLAVSRQAPARLVFAGAEQCEYVGSLASPELAEVFPAAGVARLAAMGLIGGPWRWRWLAPGSNLRWLEHPALRAAGIAVRTRQVVNPILALQGGDRARFFDPRRKNFRRKLNVLRRAGEVRLVRLEAGGLTEEMFQWAQTVYDIRVLALHGSAPFREDPFKGPFHRRLLDRHGEVAFLFVLTAGSAPVAFQFALAHKRRAINCLGAFDSRWGSASPGKLLGDLLAAELEARGFACFDHTPGGDPYKEEAASAHEPVHELWLFPSGRQVRAHDLRRAIVDIAGWGASRLGVAGRARSQLRRLREGTRDRSAAAVGAAVLSAVARWVWSRRCVIIYRVHRAMWDGAADGSAGTPPIRRDLLEDFLLYTGSNRWWSRQRLMAEALDRLAAGEHCYTMVDGGLLVHYGWLQSPAKQVEITETGMWLELPPGTTALYDFYTEPTMRGRGLYRRNLSRMLVDAFAAGADQVIIAATTSNRASRRAIEAVGFRPDRWLWRLQVLGRPVVGRSGGGQGDLAPGCLQVPQIGAAARDRQPAARSKG